MLHDIGIGLCEAPQLHCSGTEPYLAHGVLGRQLLEKEGLGLHALVCERHTGAGITAEEIREGGLPLPVRDYLPVSLEEKIICVADKFYSKKPGKLWKEKKTPSIENAMDRDNFLAAEEAQKFGIIDEVVDKRPKPVDDGEEYEVEEK